MSAKSSFIKNGFIGYVLFAKHEVLGKQKGKLLYALQELVFIYTDYRQTAHNIHSVLPVYLVFTYLFSKIYSILDCDGATEENTAK